MDAEIKPKKMTKNHTNPAKHTANMPGNALITKAARLSVAPMLDWTM